jgi:hypothetical protein
MRDRAMCSWSAGMQLDLTDEQTAELLAELNRIIQNDRYPLSRRIRLLHGHPREASWRADAATRSTAAANRPASPCVIPPLASHRRG